MLLLLNDNFNRADTSTGSAGNTTSVGNGWIDTAGGVGSISSDRLEIATSDYAGHPISRPALETETALRLIVVTSSALIRAVNANANDFLGTWISGSAVWASGFGALSLAGGSAALSASITGDIVYFIRYSVTGGTGTLTSSVYDSNSVFIDSASGEVLDHSGGSPATPLATITGTTTSAAALSPCSVALGGFVNPTFFSQVLIYDEALAGISVSPTSLTSGTTGNAVTVTGTGTSWTAGTPGSPTLSLTTSGSGASITAQTIASTTSAALTISAGTAGTITITDPSISSTATITVANAGDLVAGTLSSSASTPSGIVLNYTGTTGGVTPYTETLHRSLTAGFTPSGGTAIASAPAYPYTDVPPDQQLYYYKHQTVDDASTVATSVQCPAALPPAKLAVGMIGDSWTDYYAAELQQDLIRLTQDEVAVIDEGVAGTGTSDWLSGGAPATILTNAVTAFLAAGVTVINFMLGTNDANTAHLTTPDDYATNLGIIFTYLIAQGFTVIPHYPSYAVPSSGMWNENSDALLQQYQPKTDATINGTTVLQGDKRLYKYMAQHQSELIDGIHPAGAGIEAVSLFQATAVVAALNPPAATVAFSPIGCAFIKGI